jgi:hypothetical protein
MSHADSPVSANALPSDNAPRAIPSSNRGRRGRSSGIAASKGSDAGTMGLLCRAHVDDVITDPDDPLTVADHHHRVTGARSLDNRPQHSGFRRSIQMGGGLVEKQYRRT